MVQGTVRVNVPKLIKTTGKFRGNMSALQRATGLSYPTILRLVKKDPAGTVSLDTAVAVARAFGKSLEDVIETVSPGKSG
jgi:hypothetical protein